MACQGVEDGNLNPRINILKSIEDWERIRNAWINTCFFGHQSRVRYTPQEEPKLFKLNERCISSFSFLRNKAFIALKAKKIGLSQASSLHTHFADHLLLTHENFCPDCFGENNGLQVKKSYLYHCSICIETFCNSSQLVHHVLHKHTGTPVTSVVFCCPYCDAGYSNKELLKAHLETFHGFVNLANAPNNDVLLQPQNPIALTPATETLDKNNHDFILPNVTNETPLEENEELNSLITIKREINDELTCKLCSKEFESEKSLRQHFSKHALKIKLCCQVCERNFFEKSKMHLHLQMHKSQEVCRLLLHKPDPVSTDIPEDDSDFPNSNTSFKCILCQKFTYERVDHHFSRYHTDVQYYVFQCHVCQMFFGSRKEIEAHFNKNSRKEFTAETGQVHPRATEVVTIDNQGEIKTETEYPCDRCTKSFTRARQLRKHQEICGKNEKYPCQECYMVFMFKSSLDRHVESTHVPAEAKIHVCKLCKAAFSQAKNLKKHETNHKMRKYKCEVCDKGPFQRTVLKQHMKTHMEPCKCGVCKDCTEIKRRYLCSTCGKSFSARGGLKQHEKVHDDGESRIHECHHCHKKFRASSVLKRHLKIHEVICKCGTCEFCKTRDPSTPKCEVCNKMFHTTNHLRRHMVVHTGERSYVCEICGKGFNQAGNLKVHVKSHMRSKEKLCKKSRKK